jgi:hypothetical protein
MELLLLLHSTHHIRLHHRHISNSNKHPMGNMALVLALALAEWK